MNFRIKIMSHGSSGCEDPPLPGSNDQVLKEFVIDCANKQSYSEYPDLCAYDFENKISITIHHLLGWDKNKKQNIEDKGIYFGILMHAVMLWRSREEKHCTLIFYCG